ncbi:MAG: prepilin-type N-terminal cleavage/methylation domain-containing protein [Dehalococcoidia bacterium]
MGWHKGWGRKLLRNQQGISLLELVIAIGILGLVGTAFLSALFTGSTVTGTVDEQLEADALARSVLEDVKSQPFDETAPYEYASTVTPAPGYSYINPLVAVACNSDIATCQQISAVVSRDGAPMLQVSTYKVKR